MTNNNAEQMYESMSLSKLQKFFATCGGSTTTTLAVSDPDDQQKRINAGIVVLVIALVSALLASIAWSIPMGWKGAFVGIPWFFIMFLLERSILQQMDAVASIKLANEWLKEKIADGKSKSVGWGWLILRFIMITFICYFNSEMIRVIMFKPEIIAEIKLRQDKETAHIVDSLDKVKQTINLELKKSDDALNQAKANLSNLVLDIDEKIKAVNDSISFWNSKLVYEVKGPGGVTGKSGDGPVAKQIRKTIDQFKEQHDNLIKERDNAKGSAQNDALIFAKTQNDIAQAKNKEELSKLQSRQDELIKQVMDRPVNGLEFMLSVLNDIAKRNIIIWMVFGMFFFIEAIPVLLKFFSRNDSFIYIKALTYLEMMNISNTRAAEIVRAMKNLKSEHSE